MVHGSASMLPFLEQLVGPTVGVAFGNWDADPEKTLQLASCLFSFPAIYSSNSWV